MIISRFLKSEPDLSFDDVVDELILRAMRLILYHFGFDQDESALLDPENWAYAELDDFELQCAASNPSKLLAEIEDASNAVTGYVLTKC